MVVLPLVNRELRVLSRKKRVYAQRLLITGISLGITFFILSLTNVFVSRNSGLSLFRGLSFCMMFFALIEGARSASDCISQEKREGTIGFLFLTDLSSLDVVLGKLSSASLPLFYGFLAIIPAMATAWVLGGVTFDELARMSLVLPLTMMLSLSVGIMVSCFGRDEHRNLLMALSVLGILCLAPRVLNSGNFNPLSPFTIYSIAFDSVYQQAGVAPVFWTGLAIMIVLSAAALVIGGLVLKKRWNVDVPRGAAPESEQKYQFFRSGKNSSDFSTRGELLEKKPAYWLAARCQQIRIDTIRVVASLYLAFVLFAIAVTIFSPNGDYLFPVPIFLLFRLVLLIMIGYRSTIALSKLASSGLIKVLLSTPLIPEQIVDEQKAFVWKRFLVPLLLAVFCEFLLVKIQLSQENNEFALVSAILLLLNAFYFIYVSAVINTGMFYALKLKNASRAFTKVALFLFVLPICFGWFPLLGQLLFLAWPVIWLVRCADLTRSSDFRKMSLEEN